MLMFYASNIASLIGHNPFESQKKSIEKYWKKNFPEIANKVLLRNSENIQPEVILNDLLTVDNITLIQDTIDCENTQVREQKVQELTQELVNEHHVDPTEILQQVQSHVNTERGKRDETNGIQMYTKITSKKIQNSNNKFYKRYLKDGNNIKYGIGGRVDGITEDGILVEVKNRQKRLFNYVPPYEKVQIHIYMYLLNKTECHLIECFKSDTVKHIIEFDDAFMNTIISELDNINQFLHDLNVCETLQDKFINSEENDISWYKKIDIHK